MQYVCNLTRFTRLGVTSHSQPLINAKHQFQVTNYLQTIFLTIANEPIGLIILITSLLTINIAPFTLGQMNIISQSVVCKLPWNFPSWLAPLSFLDLVLHLGLQSCNPPACQGGLLPSMHPIILPLEQMHSIAFQTPHSFLSFHQKLALLPFPLHGHSFLN
jgi:hypothetical protein